MSADNLNNKMQAYFLRHGETDWNIRKLVYGTTDIPLNHCGRSEVARKARDPKFHRLRFQAIVYGSHVRHRQTAEIFRDNHPGKNRLETFEDPRFNERDFGNMERVPLEVFAGLCPEYFQGDGLFSYVGYGIESGYNLLGRVVEAMEELRRRHEEVLIVSSLGPITTILAQQRDITDTRDIFKLAEQIPPGHLVEQRIEIPKILLV